MSWLWHSFDWIGWHVALLVLVKLVELWELLLRLVKIANVCLVCRCHVLLLTPFLCWHYDRWQGRLLPSDERNGTSRRIRVFLHIWVEGLSLPTVDFKVADSSNWAIGPQLPLLRVSEFIDVLFFLAVPIVALMTALWNIVRNLGHALRVLAKRVGSTMSESHTLGISAYRSVLGQSFIHLAQVFKVDMLECLPGRHTLTIIVDK